MSKTLSTQRILSTIVLIAALLFIMDCPTVDHLYSGLTEYACLAKKVTVNYQNSSMPTRTDNALINSATSVLPACEQSISTQPPTACLAGIVNVHTTRLIL